MLDPADPITARLPRIDTLLSQCDLLVLVIAGDLHLTDESEKLWYRIFGQDILEVS